MTFEEIVKREEANMDSIVLYHEGIFLSMEEKYSSVAYKF